MCFRTLNLKRAALALAVLLTLFMAPARASDLDDFNTAVEAAMSHRRVAAGYIRTGNLDLAALEIDALRGAWTIVTTGPIPTVFHDKLALYSETMLNTSTRLIGIVLVFELGRADVAAQSLDAIRNDLSAMRRASGVTVLADCVLDSNTAMDALFAFDGKPLDATSGDVTAKADAYRAILQRCDGMATERLRRDGEFRRLIDGATASLAQVPKAIETRDADLLHRLLIELRSFDNLLAFRFG